MSRSFRQGRKLARALCVATVLSLLPGLFVPAQASAQAETMMRTYNIPARDLGDALEQFGRQSNAQLLFSPRLVEGRRSKALKGQYSPEAALQILLDGSGLTYKRSASNVLLITPVPAPPPKPEAVKTPVPPAASLVVAAVREEPLDEIVITGFKRLERNQGAPASVLVATASYMDGLGMRDFDDIVKIAPSVTITKTSQPANNSINIRGIGTYAYSIATEASVAVVVDDVPQAFQAAAFSALVDVQQVEVLRGPQSTLFGKSASAGVINITTQPVTDRATGRIEVVATDDGEQRIQGTVSGPINDRLKFRVAGNFSTYRGNVYNLSTQHWLNGQSDSTLRGKLVWTPNPAVTMTLSPYVTRTLSSCCAGAEAFVSPGVTFGRSNEPQSAILAGITPDEDNRLTRMDVDAKADAVDYGTGLKIVRKVNGLSLASISSYDRYSLVDMQDTDSSDFDFSTVAPTAPKGGSANGGWFKINSVTQEFRVTSPDNVRLRYVAGLFYSRTHAQRYFVRGANDLGDYNGLPALPSTNSTTYAAYLSQAWATNYAVFGQATYDLTPKWGVTGGLRINLEDIRYTFRDLGNGVAFGDPPCSTQIKSLGPTVTIETCNSDTSVSGRAGLLYHFAPDVMGFVTYSRGYKGMAYDLTSTLTMRAPLTSGPLKGVAIGDAIAARQPIPPEQVDNYEIGLKSAFFDHHLVWNTTVFYESFRGFQAQSRDGITGQNILNSIGQVTSKGVESDLAARVGSRLIVNASVAYNKATMNDFPNANCYTAQTAAQGCVGGAQDLSGKPLFNAPEWNVGGNATYEVPLKRGWSGFATVAARWQSAVIFNLLQDPDSVQKAYGIVNLSGGVRNDRWKLTMFVNNLFDRRYALTRGRDTQWNINQATSPPTDAVTWKPARDSARYVGLRLSASY
ncbi:MAG TPA: TonB-dependent receptor [Asticcacaulis sp.]|nr:TonB-dependent receptor [Asticcacaulis sp.]